MHRFANNAKTAMLLAGLTGLFLLIGSRFGQGGLLIALLLGFGTSFFAYFFSHKLAIASMRGIEVTADTPDVGGKLYRMVDELRQRAGMPMPRVYICPMQAPNAFATGRNPKNAAVAITEGALRILSEDEVRGVMAHELAHVKNRDTLISCVAAMIAGALSYFAQFGLLLGGGNRENNNPAGAIAGLLAVLLAPIAAAVIKGMISRSREFVADHDAAVMVGSPNGLISALAKLHNMSQRVPMPSHNPSMNNLFIVEPFFRGMGQLFATHPPVEKRIAALQAMR
jgi:heat shock protein HtpX